MTPKYKINDILYPAGCSKEFQENNIFIPKFIELRKYNIPHELEDDTIGKYFAYSNNGYSWFPEKSLINKLS